MGRLKEKLFHDYEGDEDVPDFTELQIQSALSELREIRTDLEYLLHREKYYDERIERAPISEILRQINHTIRTLE